MKGTCGYCGKKGTKQDPVNRFVCLVPHCSGHTLHPRCYKKGGYEADNLKIKNRKR